MQISTLETVLYTSVFLLPGFVICGIVDAIIPPNKQPEYKYFLRCLFFSIISCGCWSWLFRIVFECGQLSLLGRWVLLVSTSIVGSILIGVIVAVLRQKNIIRKLANRLHICTIHAIPTAWDYYFSNQESCFIIITLTDGTELRGWYNGNSFSSSDPEERDIYVELGYDENWKPDNQSKGFYVPKDQIKYIEFKQGETVNERKE